MSDLSILVIFSEKSIEYGSSNSQIDKPPCGCPKRADLPDVNINTDVQSINSERDIESTVVTCVLDDSNPPFDVSLVIKYPQKFLLNNKTAD